jgi:hypothetical protein
LTSSWLNYLGYLSLLKTEAIQFDLSLKAS